MNAGTVIGKLKLPAFTTRDEAEKYRAALLERKALEVPAELSDLTTLAAANVRLALTRLQPYKASILEAVDFFIKFAKPANGKVSIKEAMSAFGMRSIAGSRQLTGRRAKAFSPCSKTVSRTA